MYCVKMQRVKINARSLSIVAGLVLALLGAGPPPSPVPAPIPASNYPVSPASRDNRDGFNFEFGTWRTHYRILKDRLVGSHVWYDCYGTSVIRPYWNGGGNLEDGDLKCPNRYVGGLTLRLYDPQTRQWSLWWGTRALGIAPPQQVGHFDADGTGRFYAYDTWKGTPIINRFQWTSVNGNPHFEQAFSTDRGKTWETNWTTDYERVSPATKGVWNFADTADDGHHGFDFLFGTWKTHYMRRKPFSSNARWYSCYGSSTVKPFWGGAGNLEDGDLHCPNQYVRGVTLRTYHASTRQWFLYWGTEKGGLATGLPQVGNFNANGVGDFLAPDTYDGKPILVRYRWMQRNGHPRFEESFSPDDGKTWELVWTTDYSRSQ
jgi:hypothetical protein